MGEGRAVRHPLGVRMTRAHAEEMRAWIERWNASTPEERRAELDRLDALGYAEARAAAAARGAGDFGPAVEPDNDAPPADVWGETLAAQIRRAG